MASSPGQTGSTHPTDAGGAPNRKGEQRVFPRVRLEKIIELMIGSEAYTGKGYDISQGGLSFIAADSIGIGPATIRIPDSEFVFQGHILASQSAAEPGTSRFHFQFSTAIELVILAQVLGS
jgi:hypothetical protein